MLEDESTINQKRLGLLVSNQGFSCSLELNVPLLSGQDWAAAADELTGRMYLESLTFGRAKCPPVSGITSTIIVCLPASSISITPAALPQMAQIAWSANTWVGQLDIEIKLILMCDHEMKKRLDILHLMHTTPKMMAILFPVVKGHFFFKTIKGGPRWLIVIGCKNALG